MATPLHRAARYGRKEVVEVLFRAGASLNQPNNHGQTAWHVANEWGHQEIADLINRAVTARARAFASGLHERPGQDSAVQLLRGFPNITEFIVRMAVDPKIHDEDKAPQLL